MTSLNLITPLFKDHLQAQLLSEVMGVGLQHGLQHFRGYNSAHSTATWPPNPCPSHMQIIPVAPTNPLLPASSLQSEASSPSGIGESPPGRFLSSCEPAKPVGPCDSKIQWWDRHGPDTLLQREKPNRRRGARSPASVKPSRADSIGSYDSIVILFGSKFCPLDSGPDPFVTRSLPAFRAILPFLQGPWVPTFSPQCLLFLLWSSGTHIEPWAPSKSWRNWSLCLHPGFSSL